MRAAPMTRLLALLLMASLCVPACDEVPEPMPAARYLTDGAFRRSTLEAALWQPQLPYSRNLLANYGLDDQGWDLLREMPTASRPFTTADASRLAAGSPLEAGELVDVRDGAEGLNALGERVFFGLPMRYDGYVTWLAARQDRWEEAGLRPRADGSLRGVVVYQDRLGDVRAGVTCGLCHGGEEVAGRGDRQLDLGRARGMYYEAVGADPERFDGWGPGRIDVTDDAVDSPTAIPDLWGLAHAEYLNHSGAIAVAGRETLAVRFETQYIMGHRMRTRPPRDLTWALATFVTSLEPPAAAGVPVDPETAAGAAAFTDRCAGCHQPGKSYAGDLIAAELLPVDQAVATTPERGTTFYKVPSLLGVGRNAPYLHDGSVATLEALLASGHPYGGAPIPDGTRRQLLAFLNTL